MTGGEGVPQVSVVIPCFNSAQTLEGTLESVAGQSFRHVEVVVVDDGSRDATVETARSALERLGLAGSVSRRPDSVPKGAGGSRNYGASLATGEYLAFLDSDDLWLPHHLDHAVARLEECQREIVAYCATGDVLGEGGRREPLPFTGHPTGNTDLLPELLRGMFLPNISLVCRREAFRRTTGYHEHLACYEDWWLFLQLAVQGRFWVEPSPCCLIRVRENSLSRGGAQRRYGGMSRAMYHDRIVLGGSARTAGFLNERQLASLTEHTASFLAEALCNSLRARYFDSAGDVLGALGRECFREPRLATRTGVLTMARIIGWWRDAAFRRAGGKGSAA